MNITELKSQIGITSLELNTAKDAEGNPTEWLRHWSNDTRTAVSIHKDLVSELQADSNISSLGLQTETRTGSNGDYTAHRIVRYTPAEFTL